jgi:hypothetical protein
VALRNGIEFEEDEKEHFGQSWVKSAIECSRLMARIIGSSETPGLVPHLVKNTISVNDARTVIIELSQPLAEIAQNIQNNLQVLEQHQQDVKNSSDDIEKCKANLYVPVLDLEVTTLSQPVTVCAASKCAEVYQVRELKKYHYKQRCHNPCYLQNVPKEVIGDPALMHCSAMGGSQTCRMCGCSYKIHVHVCYESKVVERQEVDDRMKDKIKTKEDAKQQAEDLIVKLRKRFDDLKAEEETITKVTANFAHFLKNNAIAPYNDSFKEYLEHLIENEKVLSKDGSKNKEVIKGLEDMLSAYEKEKQILDSAMASTASGHSSVTPEVIKDSIQQLFGLPFSGKQIRESHEAQTKARASENFTERQVIHKIKKKTSVLSKIFGGKR